MQHKPNPSSLLPAERSQQDELVTQMTAAIEALETADVDDATETYQRSTVIEVAAKRLKAGSVQIAAARLRLHAERRLGELCESAEADRVRFSQTEWRDFTRLARIPRRFRDHTLDRMNIAFAVDPSTVKKEKPKYVDLFERSVNAQVSSSNRSHTAYSVYMMSLRLSAERHKKYPWLCSTWAQAWVFDYTDPVTGKFRVRTCEGTLEAALALRAELQGKIKASDRELSPGEKKLGDVLDHARYARDALTSCWTDLNAEQQEELDGWYSRLDDLVIALVTAANL